MKYTELAKHKESFYEIKNPFSCHICDGSYYHKDTLTRHIKLVYEGERKCKCTTCDRSIIMSCKNNELAKHKESFHEIKNPFLCHICDGSYYCKDTLTRHIKFVHEGERKYKCSTCDRSYQEFKAIQMFNM